MHACSSCNSPGPALACMLVHANASDVGAPAGARFMSCRLLLAGMHDTRVLLVCLLRWVHAVKDASPWMVLGMSTGYLRCSCQLAPVASSIAFAGVQPKPKRAAASTRAWQPLSLAWRTAVASPGSPQPGRTQIASAVGAMPGTTSGGASKAAVHLKPLGFLFVSVTAYVSGKALVSRSHDPAVSQQYVAFALTRTTCCAALLRSSRRTVAPCLECSPRCARPPAAHTLGPWVCSPGPQSYGLCALRFMHSAALCAAVWHLICECKRRPSHHLAYLSWHSM